MRNFFSESIHKFIQIGLTVRLSMNFEQNNLNKNTFSEIEFFFRNWLGRLITPDLMGTNINTRIK